MRRILRLALAVLVLAALGGALWHLTRPEPVPVALAVVERATVEASVANTRAGTVRACRRSRLAPATGGRVARLTVSEGDRVAAGDLLIALWNDDLEAQLKLAGSEVTSARARLREACLRAEVAEREAGRMQRLGRERVVSVEEVDRATTNAEALRAGCEATVASLETAIANTAAARAALERTRLTAPFGGVVAEVNAELGEYITPSPPGIPTLPAIDLIGEGCLYVAAPIDEVDAPAVRTGMPACVSFDAFPERLCGARVRRIAPYVLDLEKQARTVEVEVELPPETLLRLLPGYSADVEIVLEQRAQTLRVPTEAVLEGDRVLVYDAAAGRLVERHFTAGLRNWRHTEVRDGLAEGEQIVLSVGREGVAPGAAARPDAVPAPVTGPPTAGG